MPHPRETSEQGPAQGCEAGATLLFCRGGLWDPKSCDPQGHTALGWTRALALQPTLCLPVPRGSGANCTPPSPPSLPGSAWLALRPSVSCK